MDVEEYPNVISLIVTAKHGEEHDYYDSYGKVSKDGVNLVTTCFLSEEEAIREMTPKLSHIL